MRPKPSRPSRGPTRAAGHAFRRGGGRAVVLALGVAAAAGLVWSALPASDTRSVAERYLGYQRYYRGRLTSEQLAIRNEALGAIRAPCCDQYSIATCCCPCNLARSVWGLTSRSIAERGYGPARVRAEVERWLAEINPSGAAGDACERGRCELPFHRDGCGGMDEGWLS